MFTFLDDPISKINRFLINFSQNQMRKAIDEKYKNQVPNQVYWIKLTEKEDDGLSEEKSEYLTQRMTLSQISYFISQRLWAKRTFIIFPFLFFLSIILSIILLNYSPNSSIEGLRDFTIATIVIISFFLIFGGYIFAPFVAQFILPNTAYRENEIIETEKTIKRCLIKDIEKNAPPDFHDRLRNCDIDAEGHAVAGQIIAQDLEISSLTKEWRKTVILLSLYGAVFLIPALEIISPNLLVIIYYVALYLYLGINPFKKGLLFFVVIYLIVPYLLLLMLQVVSFPTFGLEMLKKNTMSAGENVSLVALWSINLLFWFGALIATFREKSPLEERAKILEQSVKETSTELLVDRAGINYFINLEKAKKIQLNNVTNDQTNFIKLGTSTGIFSQRRDPLSPSEPDIVMGISIKDLENHLFALGASGTGKTTGVIRPTVYEWFKSKIGGTLVLDGKGYLPLEIKDYLDDYILISPDTDFFNPIENMKPDSVADIINDIFSNDENNIDPIWTMSATHMIRMACIIIHASNECEFTLTSILEFCLKSAKEQLTILSSIKEEAKLNERIKTAVHFFIIELAEMPEKTKGSIINIVRTWLSTIVNHEKLGKWVNTKQSSIKIEQIFNGKNIGVLLPENEFGQGGIAISALIMRRIYDHAKKRGDNWKNIPNETSALLIVDEVQNIITEADKDNVAISRSLGLYLVMSTQNIDGIYKRLDENSTKQMLANFNSLIALPTRSDESNKYISERASKIWKSVVERYNGIPDAMSDLNLYLNSGTDKSIRNIELFEQARLGHPRLSYLIGFNTDENNLNNQQKAILNIKLEELINKDELDTLLAIPQSAIALLNRGRVQRRDVIILDMMTEGVKV